MLSLLILTLPLIVTGNPLVRSPNIKTRLPMPYIVNGNEAKAHSWPWMVQLTYERYASPHRFTVLTGGHKLMSGQSHEVLAILVHPLFQYKVALSYDVAIIKISPAELNEHVQPINLPTLPPLVNQMCVVAGWGCVRWGASVSATLLEMQVPIVSNSLCYIHHRDDFHAPSMLCAGYVNGGIGTCKGDSGGPLMCERDGKWELQGVVSWGIPCGRHIDVYARVVEALPFLHHMMKSLR